ncbi:MAG TPA: PqqD family peptide modification chaperone [Candidatus Methanoperedens sp.]
MLTKLLFPPQWIPTQPYLSIPSLAAFLKANQCEVEQMDVNVSFYDDLLSRKGLSPYHERAYSRFKELDSRKELTPEVQKKYHALGSSALFGDYVLEKIDGAKEMLRDRRHFYDFEVYFNTLKVLKLGLKLASCAYYPTNLTFNAYDMKYSCRSSRDILLAINDREENLFIDYFEKKTVPEVMRGDPGLIGISIINTSQLIPGLTLASLIKKANSDIHINIGGSIFTRLVNETSRNADLFSIFDSVIVHEGETALLSLVKHLEGEHDIDGVPNLIYKKGSKIKVNNISSEGEDINSLPTPCFEGLPFKRYFSPELILPVLSSRGCYWGRCTFCDHGYGYSGKYRPRNTELLYNDISSLKSSYGTRFFTFQDEGLSPKLMGALSDRIIENDLDIAWLADSRFEPAFSSELGTKLADAGCKMIYFGLESANERILSCMDKGIRKENVRNICRYCADSGIWTHLFLIFGFPTETRQEAKETMDFIFQNSEIIRSMSFGSFQLTKHSKVFENPRSFDVDAIVMEDQFDLSLWYDYDVSRGMTKKETDMAIQEFYNELSIRYRDFPIWSNLDREHLFLYISQYNGSGKGAPDMSKLIDGILKKKSDKKADIQFMKNNVLYPSLKEGIFINTFNFNWARLHHAMMAEEVLKDDMREERTNVLFDTDNNRIFSVPEFAKDILIRCNGKENLSEIIDKSKGKYQLTYAEAEFKIRNFLQGLIDKNIISTNTK